MSTRFSDRSAAGRVLGERLRSLHLQPPLIVLALAAVAEGEPPEIVIDALNAAAGRGAAAGADIRQPLAPPERRR